MDIETLTIMIRSGAPEIKEDADPRIKKTKKIQEKLTLHGVKKLCFKADQTGCSCTHKKGH